MVYVAYLSYTNYAKSSALVYSYKNNNNSNNKNLTRQYIPDSFHNRLLINLSRQNMIYVPYVDYTNYT